MTTPTTVQVKLKLRNDTSTNWLANNPVLLAGELGRESNTGKIKIGNGTTPWGSLPYQPFGSLITDSEISPTAEIAVSKLADGAARQLLQTDAAGTGVEWTSNVDIPGTLDVTNTATFDGNVTVQGDLTVNGTTTTINTENLTVEDKNITIANVTSPTDVTADGAGITIKGSTDKTFNWVDATDSFTASENLDLASGKSYRINGTEVLSATAIGSALLTDSVSSTSTTTAATPNSVKTAYDLANAALPKAGGAMTGNLTLNAQSDLRFADADSSNWVALQAPATVSSNVTWTLPATDGTANQVLQTNGSGVLSFATPSGNPVNYQEFTSSGTWTKPAGVTFIYVECVSGGGGGGSGRRGAASTSRGGGGGGSGGKFAAKWMPASAAGSSVTITVGSGGSGGAARTADSTDGANGSAGGSSSFGALLIATASTAGTGGSTGTSGGNGGAPTFAGYTSFNGLYASQGGNGGGSSIVAAAGSRCALGPAGGGGGAAIPTSNIPIASAAGGEAFSEQKNSASVSSSTGGGGSAGGILSSGSSGGFGDGGGGGGAGYGGAGGSGGAGAFPGGGGGGGGASENGYNSGAGGNGGAGYVRIWSW